MSRALATADVITSVTDTTSAIMTASRSSVVRYIWNLSCLARNPSITTDGVVRSALSMTDVETSVNRGYPDYGYAISQRTTTAMPHAPTQTNRHKLKEKRFSIFRVGYPTQTFFAGREKSFGGSRQNAGMKKPRPPIKGDGAILAGLRLWPLP